MAFLCSNSPSVTKNNCLAEVDLTAVTQCGKLTLTQPPLCSTDFHNGCFLAGFYPQSCDCNVKPLTGKQRRTTLSAANECCVCEEQYIQAAASPERTDESPVTNKQRRHGKLHEFQRSAGMAAFDTHLFIRLLPALRYLANCVCFVYLQLSRGS